MPQFILLVFVSVFSSAVFGQSTNYDSIKKILQRDSIEYEQQLKEADRLKAQTDSAIESELGHVPSITTDPKEDSIKLSRKVHALLLAQQIAEEKEKRQYYLFGATVLFIFIVVVVAVKRKQLKKEETTL